MARRPLVSVVIPNYNYGRYLPATLDSVLAQDGVELEAIIVDDRSTDGSLEVARSLARDDDRVVLVEHAQNLRHIATYNDGLARATGDYVVLLSADDALAPGSLARSAAVMESRPDVGLVYGHAQEFVDDLPTATGRAETWTVWDGSEWLDRICRRGRNIIVNPEAMMRRDLFEELGGYDPTLPHSADMFLWMRAAARANVGRVNGPAQAYYRQHGDNMHSSVYGGLLDDFTEVRRTFDLFFEADGGRLSDPDRLAGRARRALAREALLRSTTLSGPEAAGHRQALIDFAVETTGSRPVHRLYRIDPPSGLEAGFKFADSVRWRIRYRRHRRFGT